MKKIIYTTILSLVLILTGICYASTYNFYTNTVVAESVKEVLTTSETKTVQTRLKKWGYYTGAVDGIYGAKTKAAVKAFQKKNGLVVDGIVGPKTAAAIGITLSSSKASSSTSNSDLNLLARCVYAEARGESYQGQVAVAAVVLNRVKSPSFPNTIAGVIYQPYAFSSVNDGQINLTPNKTAISAAQDALNGWDPTYGCLYFYNASTSTSKWIYNRTTVVTIGNHVFAI